MMHGKSGHGKSNLYVIAIVETFFDSNNFTTNECGVITYCWHRLSRVVESVPARLYQDGNRASLHGIENTVLVNCF